MAYTDICGSKLRSRLGGILNESATSHSPALLSSNQSFAKRQLEKMGWTEGTGLGKRRDGQVDHVKIRQREDEMGLGREKMLAKEVSDVWWKESVGGTLARLQKKKSMEKDKKKKKKDKKKEKHSDEISSGVKIFTDEELFAATGGARFGMRAQRRAEAKWKRTESGGELSELEEKAKASMEWNGRGKAQVATISAEVSNELSSGGKEKESQQTSKESAKKRKKSKKDETTTHSISDEECDSDREERKRKKKRRKQEKEEKKRSKTHEISPPASEEESPIEKDVKKSKDKKEKKKKKSSKK